jgi:hypothetical protein
MHDARSAVGGPSITEVGLSGSLMWHLVLLKGSLQVHVNGVVDRAGGTNHV